MVVSPADARGDAGLAGASRRLQSSLARPAKHASSATADEIAAAFSDDGAITVSTASAPPPGSDPAYAFGGTVRREANKIRVVSRLTDERSETTIWSNSIDYDFDQLPRIPRRIAVEAGNELRCGLFGASTYPRQLPNPILADYMQYCANSGLLSHDPGRALNFANRVVAAAPDFSWGGLVSAGRRCKSP